VADEVPEDVPLERRAKLFCGEFGGIWTTSYRLRRPTDFPQIGQSFRIVASARMLPPSDIQRQLDLADCAGGGLGGQVFVMSFVLELTP
jgi:hypothetical protein